MSDEYKKGYQDGFEAGFESAKKLLSRGVMPPVLQPADFCGCQVCGMSWKDGPMGYVCCRSDCPSRVTCSTTTFNRTLG